MDFHNNFLTEFFISSFISCQSNFLLGSLGSSFVVAKTRLEEIASFPGFLNLWWLKPRMRQTLQWLAALVQDIPLWEKYSGKTWGQWGAERKACSLQEGLPLRRRKRGIRTGAEHHLLPSFHILLLRSPFYLPWARVSPRDKGQEWPGVGKRHTHTIWTKVLLMFLSFWKLAVPLPYP